MFFNVLFTNLETHAVTDSTGVHCTGTPIVQTSDAFPSAESALVPNVAGHIESRLCCGDSQHIRTSTWSQCEDQTAVWRSFPVRNPVQIVPIVGALNNLSFVKFVSGQIDWLLGGRHNCHFKFKHSDSLINQNLMTKPQRATTANQIFKRFTQSQYSPSDKEMVHVHRNVRHDLISSLLY